MTPDAAVGGASVRLGTELDHETGELVPVRDAERPGGRRGSELLPEIKVLLYPQAGEAVAVWMPALDVAVERQEGSELVDEGDGGACTALLALDDEAEAEARRAANQLRSVRRSRARMRRFMVQNRLTKMWVLTFAGEGLHGDEGRQEAMRLVSLFMRRLRREFFRDRKFAYCFSPELHPGGHGWHINLFLKNVYIDKRQMQRVWAQGNVWYTDFTTDTEDWLGRRLGRVNGTGGGAALSARTARTGARRAASYAAKYGTKDWNNDQLFAPGVHRYEVSEGHQPKVEEFRVRTFDEAAALIAAHPSFGELVYAVSSSEWDDYEGPPVTVCMFDPPVAPRKRRARRRESVQLDPG